VRLVVHALRPGGLRVDLSGFLEVTLDDCLHSQYANWPGEEVSVPIVLFVSPFLLHKGGHRDAGVPSAEDAMRRRFLLGRTDDYMTLDELMRVASDPRVTVGCHSYFHATVLSMDHVGLPLSWLDVDGGRLGSKLFTLRSRLSVTGYDVDYGRFRRRTMEEYEEFVRTDTEMCLEWFRRHLGISPRKYCFPFNDESETLTEILTGYGFTEFYGRERVPLEFLLR
jgi:hypothetical protein